MEENILKPVVLRRCWPLPTYSLGNVTQSRTAVILAGPIVSQPFVSLGVAVSGVHRCWCSVSVNGTDSVFTKLALRAHTFPLRCSSEEGVKGKTSCSLAQNHPGVHLCESVRPDVTVLAAD